MLKSSKFMKYSFPSSLALIHPHVRTLPPPYVTLRTVLLSLATPYISDAIRSRRIDFGLIWPEYWFPKSLPLCQYGPWQRLSRLSLCLWLQQWLLAWTTTPHSTSMQAVSYCGRWDSQSGLAFHTISQLRGTCSPILLYFSQQNSLIPRWKLMPTPFSSALSVRGIQRVKFHFNCRANYTCLNGMVQKTHLVISCP